MPFVLKGYVLEPPRVGSANSPFTITPNNFISDQPDYNAAFPNAETNPRVEYLTLVLVDGDLPDAQLGWSKNEIIQRFDYNTQDQQFRPLRGAPIIVVGKLSPDSNTKRFKVAKPVEVIPEAPFRLSVGTSGSGSEFAITLVANNGSFGSPAQGVVELSQTTGDLNWNTSDLIDFEGDTVRFQRQSFYGFTESNGKIGTINQTLLLNPIPGLGVDGDYQIPLIRVGYGRWLQATDVANDAALGVYSPAAGEVAWSRTTGLLKFSSSDITDHSGEPIYYEGVLFTKGLTFPQQSLGTVASPSSLSPVPTTGGDILFRASSNLTGGSATFLDNLTLFDSSADFFTAGITSGDELTLTSGPSSGRKYKISFVFLNFLQVEDANPFTSLSGADYEINRRVQFPITKRVTTIDPSDLGVFGEVQVDDSGAVKFSLFDEVVYASYPVTATVGDLLVERGVSLRFFRTPADPGAIDPTTKDVSATYPVTGAILADPVIGSPQVFLPIIPLDDGSFVVRVEQGTGTFVSDDLPRLDVAVPPSDPDPIMGYMLDLDQRILQYAERVTDALIEIEDPTGAVAIQPLIRSDNLVLEIETGTLTNVFTPLVLGKDALFDPTGGVVSFISTQGEEVARGSSGETSSGTTFQDNGADFTGGSDPVQVGDFLVISAGPAKGVYGIVDVVNATTLTLNETAVDDTGISYVIRHQKEVLADRFFSLVQVIDPSTKVERIRGLGVTSNSPRLKVNKTFADVSRFRFGATTFSTSVVLVDTDADFTDPSLISSATVQISLDTGNLNFSQADVDVGEEVYWVRTLRQGIDYRLTASTALQGLFDFTDRLLTDDELLISYLHLNVDGSPSTSVVEQATFIIRTEIVQPHPAPTSVLTFNPTGRTVASNPAPRVWRGGRPQGPEKVTVDIVACTITFLPDNLIDNTIPHGAIVQPSENVYISYYIYEAVGGEKSTIVLQPPIDFFQVQIVDGANSFTVRGDMTAQFPTDYMLRIEQEAVYLLDTPSYDPGTDLTTVTLATPQEFGTDYTAPNLFVSSGPTRTSGTMFAPSYFTAESNPYESIPRGMNKILIEGDRSTSYTGGTIVMLSASSPFVQNFYYVTGSNYKPDLDRTEVLLTGTTSQQYSRDVHTLSRSLRPLLEKDANVVHTANAPVVPEDVIVFRQTEGDSGVILVTPRDYNIDQTGQITLKSPLDFNEEISAFYTGFSVISAGPRLRASYTAVIVPSEENGLLNQVLTADYATFSPDSFYYRVETMANFKAEVSKQYRDKALSGSPSGGPRTSNTSQPKLFDQGSKSVFFDEKHLGNEDIVARTTLKFYNDAVNYLEDVLGDMDGRIVGDSDGRFLFDGVTDNPQVPPPIFPQFPPGPLVLPPETLSESTNQIDDQILASPFPINEDITPYFPLNFVGTYQPVFMPGPLSRIYSSKVTRFGMTVGGSDTGAKFGDQIFDLKATNITTIDFVARRRPRARVLRPARAGDTTLYVTGPNNIDSTDKMLRPKFVVGMAVDITAEDGTVLVENPTPENPVSPALPNAPDYTISAIQQSPDRLVLNTPLLVPIPTGSTIAPPLDEPAFSPDTGYVPVGHIYRLVFEYLVDVDKGKLLYPFDLSVFGAFSPPMVMPSSQERWDVTFTYVPSGTPKRIPALFGVALNDDGDESLPLINPTLTSELALLTVEQDFETDTLVSPNVTDPLLSTGSLDAGKTTITNLPGNFPTPVPEIYDLVRILDGLNGATQYRRVVSATASTLTVDVPFDLQDTGFNYLVTVSDPISSGLTGTFGVTTLTDVGATFQSDGVKVGYTVVAVTGPSIGIRRQVTDVTQTVLTVDAPWPGLGVGDYRVDNPLNTFSDTQELIDSLDSITDILSTNVAPAPPASLPFNNETLAVEALLDLVFTDKLNPASQTGTVNGDVLTGTDDFVAEGIDKGQYVYIRTGANKGIYPIKNPPAPTTTTLTIDGVFPSTGSVTYRICKPFGVTQTKSLKDIFAVLAGDLSHVGVDDILADSAAFKVKVETLIDVLVAPATPDPTMYANGLLPSDISDRTTQVSDRLATLSDPAGPITLVENVMSAQDRLYEKRFTWIDARTNLSSGILPKQMRAVEERQKALVSIAESLIQLQAVQE